MGNIGMLYNLAYGFYIFVSYTPTILQLCFFFWYVQLFCLHLPRLIITHMKKTLLLLFAVSTALFVACHKNSPEQPQKQVYDGLRPFPIRAAQGTRAYIYGDMLTGKQVVQQTWAMRGTAPDGTKVGDKSFTAEMRDTVNPALKLLMKDVVYTTTQDDTPLLEGFFLTLRDVVFVRNLHIEKGDTTFCGYEKDYSGSIQRVSKKDTVAYVPNAQLEKAEPLVRAAFAKGDYEQCYKILQTAYTFIPITGAQWRKLKAEKKN